MLPLTLAIIGSKNEIKKIAGNNEQKQHLADLGFVVGGSVLVVSAIDGNLIVNVKGTRVAIGKALAAKIMV